MKNITFSENFVYVLNWCSQADRLQTLLEIYLKLKQINMFKPHKIEVSFGGDPWIVLLWIESNLLLIFDNLKIKKLEKLILT